jgi:hypothetical protein
MKFRDAAWFWFGMVAAVSAADGISFRITPRTRFPDPSGAVLFYAVAALFPTFGFYISGRISSGLFPKREMRTDYWLLLFVGAAYPLVVGGLGSTPRPYGQTLSVMTTFLIPCLAWLLLSKKTRSENRA